MVRILDSLCESSSWLRLPSRKKESVFLYTVQSASLMEPLTAAYKGSTSTRGLRGALAFLLTSVCREARLGSVPDERVGVVDTSISFGRMVPAMVAVVTRRGGAQCVAVCALRVGRAAGTDARADGGEGRRDAPHDDRHDYALVWTAGPSRTNSC